jgi:anaerobic selenocysteine-containing dehydrogenase
VHLNALDAADAGISEGQLVRVAGATGSLVATAVVNDDIRRGAVSIPHGFDTNVGRITTTCTDLDSLTGMVLLVGLPVKVEPVSADRPSRITFDPMNTLVVRQFVTP